MMKNIKYYYNYLDLPYNATEQDVVIKQKTMTRLYRLRAIKKGKTSNSRINRINQSASILVGYIRENNPNLTSENHRVSLKNELFALILVTLICFAFVFMLL